jgi:O-antigen/teichoic acid export membrane protein
VLVAIFVQPGLNAYFYMAWTIGITLDLLAANMALSLTVEGAFDPVALARHAKAALRRLMMLLVPVSIGLALLAPVILGLFGPGYAKYGAPILVLLAAATVPRTLTEIYLGVLRAQNRTSFVALIQGIRAALILALTLMLTRSMGIVGAGVAVLAVQVAMAIGVLPGLLRVLRGDRAVGQAAATVPATGPAQAEVREDAA